MSASETTPLREPQTTRPGLEPIGGCFAGVTRDFKLRSKYYMSDWTDGICMKTVSSSLFMFFATFTSTLALGQHVHDSTDGLFGINEYLMMNSVAGILHTLFGCQPLLVLRPTGPVTLLIEKLVEISKSFSFPFWPFFAWTGIFVSLLMFIIAATEFSCYIRKMTRFTENIFGFFIGTIYVWDGLSGMLALFGNLETEQQKGLNEAMTLISLNFTTGFVVIALLLGQANHTHLFNKRVRHFMVDYAITISLAVSCLMSVFVYHLGFPMTFIDASTVGLSTSADRAWVSDLASLEAKGILMAAASAMLIVIFFYLDQNISAWVMQAPEMNLHKGDYYHSSFIVMGALDLVGPMFGLPFVTGSLPHSPQFAMSLADLDEEEHVEKVHENRIAPLIMYALLAVPLFVPSLLSVVPMAAVSGTLIVVGLSGLYSTQLYERIMLMITDPSCYPEDKSYAQVPATVMHMFTILQLICVAGCWLFNLFLGLTFPLFVACLLPFRSYVLPWLFSERNLELLEDEEDLVHRFKTGYLRSNSMPPAAARNRFRASVYKVMADNMSKGPHEA